MTKKKFKKPNRKGRDKSGKLTSAELQQEIVNLLRKNPKKRYNPRQIAKNLKIKNSKDSVLSALLKLSEAGQVKSLEDFKFQYKRGVRTFGAKRLAEGYVDSTRTGSAYIQCEGEDDDIFVSQKNLGPALHGDLVQVAFWTPRGRRKPEGEIVKVIERATDRFVGTLHVRSKNAFVVPTRMGLNMEIFVALDDVKGGEDGDMVVVKITKWHRSQNGRPAGTVETVLGAEGSDLEMNVILINNGFNLEHEPATMEEAEDLPDHISKQDIHRRRDFRKVTTFTIDPEDAKDFDDALSIEFLDNGNMEIGVHIADVTHYVKPGSALDKEAYERSTSVYLVDRVLPMLPERLSNGLCSLRPNEDKLTFSAVFEFDNDNRVVKRWFGKAIIHSDQRFSYEDAQIRLEGGNRKFAKELRIINSLAKHLRKQRFKNGAIDFDMEEVRFRLDEEGVPIEAYVKERKDAHMLIEEFMLLANREVATFINKKAKGQPEIPFVYRVHDYPNPDKVADLAKFAKELGFQINTSSPQSIAKSFNQLVAAAEKDGALRLLQPLAVRTMAKAEYSTDNIGHYGLAFDHYSHFTSPIRRYSDVLAHRILEANLGEKTMRVDHVKLQEQCKHISLQERKAMAAERESIKYKQVEFMEKHIGEVFQGYISGIIDRGIFVELEGSKCEGMVGFESMDEPFDVPESRLQARGLKYGTVLKMGDLVKVRILDTNLAKRQIEMELAE